MAKGSKRKTETSRRTRKRKTTADTASSFDVASITRAAGLEPKFSKLVEGFMSDLRTGCRRQFDLLDWHASDKQIEKRLTQVVKRADALSKAVQSKPIEDKLRSAFVRTADFQSTDQPEMETYLKSFDDDLAAARRIREVARKALQLHDKEAKAYPDQGKLPSAANPELQYIAKCIVTFWTKKLGRGTADESAHDLCKFAVQVFDQITGELREENAIRNLIRSVLDSESAKAGRRK